MTDPTTIIEFYWSAEPKNGKMAWCVNWKMMTEKGETLCHGVGHKSERDAAMSVQRIADALTHNHHHLTTHHLGPKPTSPLADYHEDTIMGIPV
jgi:hypothetical protein